MRKYLFAEPHDAPPEDSGVTTATSPTATADGCHAGADEMRKAADAAGKSEVLERYAAD